MVFPGERDYMATTTTRFDRSNNLQNFTLPNLRMGSQQHLKDDSMSSGGSGDHRLRRRRRSPPLKLSGSSVSIPSRLGEADHRSNKEQHHRLMNAPFKSVDNNNSVEGIEEFRVKIMSDLKMVRDKITQSMLSLDVIEKPDEERQTDVSVSVSGSGQEKEREVSPVKPWKLRKRRTVCKEASSGNKFHNSSSKGIAIEERIVNQSPSRNDGTIRKERGEVAESPKTKLFVPLSKKEIEDDFMAMLGHRPPRRPKKRPRTVQKNLDNLFPGLDLSEVTLNAYKVPEEAKNQQRR